MIDFYKFKQLTKRKNNSSFVRTWYFSSLFSKHLSYILFKIGFSANSATILFFFVGLIGSFLVLFNNIWAILISYAFFRLHIIIDLSDGDLARYYKTFTLRGAYMDFMIHALIYPLYIIFYSIIAYINFENIFFLYSGIFLSLLMSLILASKNNYFRALFQNGIHKNDFISKFKITLDLKSKFKNYLINLITDIISIEGFIFFNVLIFFLQIEIIYTFLHSFYMFTFLIVLIIKFFNSLKNKIISKN